jgi:hypothetical protein
VCLIDKKYLYSFLFIYRAPQHNGAAELAKILGQLQEQLSFSGDVASAAAGESDYGQVQKKMRKRFHDDHHHLTRINKEEVNDEDEEEGGGGGRAFASHSRQHHGHQSPLHPAARKNKNSLEFKKYTKNPPKIFK